jgi:hypothetical protein
MKKRVTCLTLCLVLFAALFSVQAFAAFGKCGDNVSWSLDSSGVMTISGTGAMYDYTKKQSFIPDDEEMKVRAMVKKVIIGKGVTAIGAYAFYNFPNLTEIILPNTMQTIGGSAFLDCSSLDSIYLPASVQSVADAPELPFLGCSATMKIFLESAKAPASFPNHWNAWKVYYAFGNNQYKELTVCYGYSRNEYNFFAALDGAETDVTVPSNIRKICPDAFSGNESLTRIYLPRSVKVIEDSAFAGCTALMNVDYEGSMDDALLISFGENNSSLNFADWHFGTAAPAELRLPAHLFTIEEEAFANLGAERIIVPAFVRFIDSRAFADCANLQLLYFEGSPDMIASDIADGCTNVTVSVEQGSSADTWAKDAGLPVVYH